MFSENGKVKQKQENKIKQNNFKFTFTAESQKHKNISHFCSKIIFKYIIIIQSFTVTEHKNVF